MLKQKLLKSAIICDFDGCLCHKDVFDEIMDHFTGIGWRRFGKAYEKGEISHSEMTRLAIGLLKCFPDELNQFLFQKMKIRDGYEEFRAFSKKAKIPLIIVSTGCDYYIRQVLNQEPLGFLKSDKDFDKINPNSIVVIANHLEFNEPKGLWEVSFPWGENPDCFCHCSPCKKKIVRGLRGTGIKWVIGIGDGLSDRCLATEVNFILARGSLKNFCKTNAVSFCEFDDFREVLEATKKFLSDKEFNLKK